MRYPLSLHLSLAVLTHLASTTVAHAEDVAVAVATNFAEPLEALGAKFTEKTGNKLVISSGASGQLYTQITQAAPFDVFLSADATRPAKAVADGFGVDGSVFTYAIGTLVLYSTDPALVTGEDTLKNGTFAKLSVADPKTAPYGAAAMETLAALNLTDSLTPKLVVGQNIAQAYQFVASGSAELGFVGKSQVVKVAGGSRWEVPERLHAPIQQDAVLLKAGEDNAAAKAFLDFLRGPEAAEIIKSVGYATKS